MVSDMAAAPLDDVFDRLRQEAADRIDRHGYTAVAVGTGECSVAGCSCRPERHPYAYSLGFTEHDHPELVTFGLPIPAANMLIDPVLHAARSGEPMAIGREHRHRIDGGPVVALVPVPELWLRRDPGRFSSWIDLYGPPLPPVVQICWADHHERMPWEPGCDEAVVAAQPILADDPLRYPPPPHRRGRRRRR